MKNFTSYLLFLASAALIVSSCSTSSDLSSSSAIQKRRYTKGYHLNIPGKYKEKTQQLSVNRVEPIESQVEVTASANVDALEKQPVISASANVDPIEHNVSASVDETAIVFEAIKTIDLSTNETSTTPKANFEYHFKSVNSQSKSQERKSLFSKSHSTVSAPIALPPQGGGSMLLYIILAILLPPLAVGLLYGITTEFWISLLLTILGYLPGIIYSLIVVLRY